MKFPGPTRHRDGWALWAKRLERGSYGFPFGPGGAKQITAGELGALLEGIDLQHAKRRKRYLASNEQDA